MDKSRLVNVFSSNKYRIFGSELSLNHGRGSNESQAWFR